MSVFTLGVASGALSTSGGGTCTLTDTNLGGRQPKGWVLVAVAHNAVGGTPSNGAAMTVALGSSDGTVRCMGIVGPDAITTNENYVRGMNDKALFLFDPAGTDDIIAECTVATTTDGIVLTNTLAPATAWRVSVWMIADGDKGTVEAKLVEQDTGSSADVDPGWAADWRGSKAPDFVAFLSAVATAFNDTSVQPGYLAVGLAANGPNGGRSTSWSWRTSYSATSQISNIHSMLGVSHDHNDTTDDGYNNVTFTTNGFSFGGTAGSTNIFACLCIRSSPHMNARIVEMTVPGSASTVYHEHVGIRPSGGLILAGLVGDGNRNTVVNSNVQASAVSIGAFRTAADALSQWGMTVSMRDNIGTTDTRSLADDEAVRVTSHTGAAALNITGVQTTEGSDGFSVDYSAVISGTAKMATALLLGEPDPLHVRGLAGLRGKVEAK